MSVTTVKELCELMWEAERRFDLLTWKSHDVYVWQALRMNVYYLVAAQTGVLERPQKSERSVGRPGGDLSWFRNTLLRNLFAAGKPCDAVVFENPRYMTVDGENVDVYTKPLTEDFDARSIEYQLVDMAYRGRHEKADHPRRCYGDVVVMLGALRRKLARRRLNTTDLGLINEVEKFMGERAGAEVRIRGVLDWGLNKIVAEYPLYRRFFEIASPREVYCVVAYSITWVPMIMAAKDCGAEVIELQHGTISRYHLGYSFPDTATRPSLAYIADRFYAWSDFWASAIDLPFRKNAVRVFGYRHFDERRKKYDGVEKIPNQLIVISQGAIGSSLADLMLRHADELAEFKIVYKLHPGEYDHWDRYASLVELSRRGNVDIVQDVDLYRLLAESEYQIGVFSTAIYEGIEFGLKTVLADLPGIEYMSDLLENGTAVTFQSFIGGLGG